MSKIKKHLSKVLVFTLSIFVFFGLINVKAGYTYNSKGEPIYSTEGFTVNNLTVDYNKLGIVGKGTPEPTDLFVYNIEKTIEDDSTINDLVPQVLYLTDKNYNTVYVFNTDFEKIQEIKKVRFNPNKLYSTNVTSIKTRNADGTGTQLMFETTADVPTDEELNDPEGLYGGKGYLEIELYQPNCTYRKVLSTGQEFLYICDSGNNQILVLDYNSYDEETDTYEVYQVVTKPTEELEADDAFIPQKLVVDDPGRMYVIAKEVLEGIMQFSKEGEFARYTGTNEITLTAWEIFWRNFASDAQRASMKTLYNTEFLSLVYYQDMIYTTSSAIKNSNGTFNDKIMIKKINPSGKDTLRRNGYQVPMGDVKYANTATFYESASASKPNISSFVGITVNSYGTYSVLDKTKGRIFTYDNEGNLLYISGSQGIQDDKISSNPVSIQYFGDNLLVLDKSNNTGRIIIFEVTEIASLINKAVKLEKKGQLTDVLPQYNSLTKTWWIDEVDTKISNQDAEYEIKDNRWFIDGKDTEIEVDYGSSHYWEEVVKKNSNYEYAYVGIGHKYLNEDNFKEAMNYFKLGQNKVYYSKAYKQYRDGIIKKWFAPVVIIIVVLVIGKNILKHVRNKKLGIKKVEETGVGDE